MNLKIYDHFPVDFLKVNLNHIRKVFPESALIHIKGKQSGTVFLSTLLHGNETTSFYVLKKLAHWLKENQPFRDILIFIGNVWACEKGVRHLENQVDFNRIWDGHYHCKEWDVLSQVIKTAQDSNLYANIDIHNNTGKNPVYACVNNLKKDHLKLAEFFSSRTVYYTYPPGTQSIVFSKQCPSVTIECGQSGYQPGIHYAFSFILKTLNSRSLEGELSEQQKIYKTLARIEIDKRASIAFGEDQIANIVFSKKLENMNFKLVPEGYFWAKGNHHSKSIYVINKQGIDITDEFFSCENQNYILKQKIIPAMLTSNEQIIRQDCLGYLMSKMDLNQFMKKT